MELTPVKPVLRSRAFTVVIVLMAVFLMHFSLQLPLDKINATAHANALAFREANKNLAKVATRFQLNKAGVGELRQAVTASRMAYKKVEFLLEFFYPEYVEEHINGAPLLHIERYDTRPFVLQPQGLQVLDELTFGDEAYQNKTEIAGLSQQLFSDYEVLWESFKSKEITNTEIVDAMRMELVRIFSMGVTGFDTPGSVNALAEARVAMQALQAASQTYLETSDADVGNRIGKLFNGAIESLNGTVAFDDFDRLVFLKSYVDPLYAELARFNSKIIATASKSMGWNPASTGIFATDFLDPYFYSQLSREEDSEALHMLGKKLFYDPFLSQNNQMSCATCHDPARGFTDGQAKSLSIVEGQRVQRNAPTLLNAVYADRYFYDLRAFSLEQQAEHVIFNHLEFNTAYAEIIKKLSDQKEYRALVKKALGQRELDRNGFSAALASYVLSLQSFNSQFDQYVRGEVESIDPKVKEGFNLFMGKAACATCHFAPTFAGLVPPRYVKNESEILGVLEDPGSAEKQVDTDGGRLASNMYTEMAWIFEKSFKTSTVRNVELTAPYFHNGAYQTLEEVVDFYNHGGGVGLGLQVVNQTLPGDSLNLGAGEKQALVAFMKSLTDNRAGTY